MLFIPTVTTAAIATPFKQIDISMTPTNPQPGDIVTAKLSTIGIPLTRSKIQWIYNGTKNTSVNNKSFTFTVDTLGKEQNLTVIITEPSGEVISKKVTFTPAEVTLLWEGDTYTPPFYTGKPLYTVGSLVRLEARPLFKQPNGTVVDPTKLVYLWKKNGTELSDYSGIGKQTLTIKGPSFLRSAVYEVSVSTPSNSLKAHSAVLIDTKDPVIRLYQYDPLLGVEYYNPVGINETIPATRLLQVQAEPYYMTAQTPNSKDVEYQWLVNNAPVYGNQGTPSRISISFKSQQKASMTIRLMVSHLKNILQTGEGIFNLSFEGSPRGSFFGM